MTHKYKLIFVPFIWLASFYVEASGCIFLNTVSGWQYGGVYVDGEWVARIQNGFSYFCMKPGSYKITSFKQTRGTRSYQSTSTLDVNISLRVEEDALTSVGTLVIFDGFNSSKVIFLENNDTALEYVKAYYPDKYQTYLSREVIQAALPYKNKYLDDVRVEYLTKQRVKPTREDEIYADELGILIDMRNENPQKIETGLIRRLSASEGGRGLNNKVFLSSLRELFVYDGAEFRSMPMAAGSRPVVLAQSEKWVFTTDDLGNLSYTSDLGRSWTTKKTRIASDESVYIVSDYTDNYFIFGPLTYTSGDTTYKKRVGYIVNGESAEVQEIKWSKYVTAGSKFLFVNGVCYLDPVSLDRKTFLFYYNDKKNKWIEVRLPNRHCRIEANSQLISLICRKGSDYNFAGIGSEWEKVTNK